MVTPCHGTFVGVDLRHELAQRRSKGSLSSTADPILALLKVTLLLGFWYFSVTSNGHYFGVSAGQTSYICIVKLAKVIALASEKFCAKNTP